MRDGLTFQRARPSPAKLLAIREAFTARELSGHLAIEVADIPFYDRVGVYRITDLSHARPNVRYAFSRGRVVVAHDWSAKLWALLNVSWGLALDAANAAAYLRFALSYFRFSNTGFITLMSDPEDVDALAWPREATPEVKRRVEAWCSGSWVKPGRASADLLVQSAILWRGRMDTAHNEAQVPYATARKSNSA
jgi:hypothetical protein